MSGTEALWIPAAIGAVGGAVSNDKNPLEGALMGGTLGAAGGAFLGPAAGVGEAAGAGVAPAMYAAEGTGLSTLPASVNTAGAAFGSSAVPGVAVDQGLMAAGLPISEASYGSGAGLIGGNAGSTFGTKQAMDLAKMGGKMAGGQQQPQQRMMGGGQAPRMSAGGGSFIQPMQQQPISINPALDTLLRRRNNLNPFGG